jgi:hypothetical protein
LLEVKALDPICYDGLPGGYMAPKSCFFAPGNSTTAPRGKIASRAKASVPGADRAANKNVTGFLIEGMESLQLTYGFLRLCDPWVALSFFTQYSSS